MVLWEIVSDDIESYSELFFCLDKVKEFFVFFNLFIGLLLLKDMIEVGYNKIKGFVWMRMRSKIEYIFVVIGCKVIYDMEIIVFVEDCRLKRLMGVKSKEFMIWVLVYDIFIKEKEFEKIIFVNNIGLLWIFKVLVF